MIGKLSDEVWFEYCLDDGNRTPYTKSSGGVRIVPKLQSNVQIRYGRTEYINHVGPALDCKSTSEGDFVARGVEVRRRTANVLLCGRASDEHPGAYSSCWSQSTKKTPSQEKCGRSHNGVYWFDLKARATQRIGILANHLQCHLAVRFHATGLLGEGGQKKFVRHRSRTFVSEDVT